MTVGVKTPCLGTHSGSLNKTLVTHTHNLGASGDWAPVRLQPLQMLVVWQADSSDTLSFVCKTVDKWQHSLSKALTVICKKATY